MRGHHEASCVAGQNGERWGILHNCICHALLMLCVAEIAASSTRKAHSVASPLGRFVMFGTSAPCHLFQILICVTSIPSHDLFQCSLAWSCSLFLPLWRTDAVNLPKNFSNLMWENVQNAVALSQTEKRYGFCQGCSEIFSVSGAHPHCGMLQPTS